MVYVFLSRFVPLGLTKQGHHVGGTWTVLAADTAWDGETSKQREAIHCASFTERFYSSGVLEPILGSEMTVVARIRIGWMRFRECGEVLHGRTFSFLAERENVSDLCKVGNGSETCCLREREVARLRNTERAMVSAMCGLKVIDRKNTNQLL